MSTIRAGHLDAQYAWDSVLKDPDWMFKMGIGGMINAGCMLLAFSSFYFTPFAFAFLALIAGYTLRFIRYRVKDPDIKLPLWNEWLELLMSGLTWLAIQFDRPSMCCRKWSKMCKMMQACALTSSKCV